MKRKAGFKIGGMLLAMLFCIFFGVSLVTQGTERIHGPLAAAPQPQPRPYTSAPAGKGAPLQGTAHAAATKQTAAKPLPPSPVEPAADTGVNRVGNKTGELLQIAAHHGISWIVSLFEALMK